MKWLLKFKRRDAPDGEGVVCTVVRCAESDLQGERESAAMEFEKNSGEAWICVEAVRLTSREDRHDD